MSVDYTMYNTYGSVNAVIDRTLQVLNLSQVNYTIANGLSDDVYFKVTEHYITTCDTNCNYWPSTLDINENYNQFKNNAYRMFTKPYDIKIHWQNQGGPGSIIGLGSYVMCGTSGIAVVKNYSGNADYTRAILSHEIGHNLGCVHTTGFIMNPSINQSNTWAPESITSINNSFATLSCISNCNALACDNKKVSNAVVTTDLVNNKINASWLAESGIDFKVRLYNYNSNTWSGYTTFTYPANTTSYSFAQTHCTDKYRIEITPICTGIDGVSEQIIFDISKNVAAPSLTFNGVLSTPICSSRTAFFGVTSVDGGTTPIYQWKINGSNVGTNSPNFSPSTINNGDILSCELTSNATCVASPTATVSVTLTVTTPTILSVSVSANATTICPGDSVIFTATGTNVTSGFPYYSWQVNGQPLKGGATGGNGASGPVITDIPLNNGDIYTCTLMDGEGCHTTPNASSNPVTITIRTDCTLTVDDFSIIGLNYYPNPVKDFINVTDKEIISAIKVYTLLGQKILSKTVNSDKTTLDLSGLSKGNYLLKIEAEGKTKTVKIVKE